MNKQQRWEAKQLRANRCMRCGKHRINSKRSVRLCSSCLDTDLQRKAERKRTKRKARKVARVVDRLVTQNRVPRYVKQRNDVAYLKTIDANVTLGQLLARSTQP